MLDGRTYLKRFLEPEDAPKVEFAHREAPPKNIKDPRPVVYSIVSNSAVYDSRVMKQAYSLRDAGYRVCLYAAEGEGLTDGVVNGIEFRRFKPFDFDPTLSESERQTVLELFGPDRRLVEAKLAEIGAQSAKVSTMKAKLLV